MQVVKKTIWHTNSIYGYKIHLVYRLLYGHEYK
jgi:hypothetical protein